MRVLHSFSQGFLLDVVDFISPSGAYASDIDLFHLEKKLLLIQIWRFDQLRYLEFQRAIYACSIGYS
ncbi:hypothetical protein L6164_036262 [Bauhinia variegata]|uniref:Uncharacterized protein n=1 Tax=Bauhinia variegata TaxID=167791 RepID=A0ACB9KGH3_BAUVA|nr:hypothetical protein L6164_036262 [Bauhinia variegata]